MIERRKVRPTLVALAAAAVTALGVGGAAIAQSGGTAPDQPAEQQTAPDQKAPEQGAPENSVTDPDNVQDESGKDDATEKAEGPEKAETPGQESREVPDDDGPGGHADEPQNPNADHQFQGKE